MSQTGKLKLKCYHFDDDYFEFICLKQFKMKMFLTWLQSAHHSPSLDEFGLDIFSIFDFLDLIYFISLQVTIEQIGDQKPWN